MNRPARQTAVPRHSVKCALKSAAPETLWDKLDQLSASVPLAKWRRVPPDLARNVKHYLNGQPKK